MVRTKLRHALLFALATLAALALAPTASAQKPTKEPVEQPPDEVIEGICAFPVLIETVVNNEKLLTFPDGSMLITGTLKVRVTNVDDPANSRLLNISGPGKITPTPDGGEIVEARGTWLWVFMPDELGPGEPGQIILTTGRARAVFEADGSASFTVLSGRRIDVCALLA
jgi:hypothetical protein